METRTSTSTGSLSGTKLSAPDGEPGDTFGHSVAVSDDGSTAIVGAVYDEDPNGESAGSAYVFE